MRIIRLLAALLVVTIAVLSTPLMGTVHAEDDEALRPKPTQQLPPGK